MIGSITKCVSDYKVVGLQSELVQRWACITFYSISRRMFLLCTVTVDFAVVFHVVVYVVVVLVLIVKFHIVKDSFPPNFFDR